jgi:hypothetical protein
MVLMWPHSSAISHRDVATDSKALWPRIRKASRARAPDSPMSSEGEVGCLFDEIGNLVEPTERLHMDVQAGLTSHGWRGVARTARPTKNSRCCRTKRRGPPGWVWSVWRHSSTICDTDVATDRRTLRSRSGRRAGLARLTRRCRPNTWMCERADQTKKWHPRRRDGSSRQGDHRVLELSRAPRRQWLLYLEAPRPQTPLDSFHMPNPYDGWESSIDR